MNIDVNIYPASTGQTGTFSLATIDELRAGTGGNKAIPTDVLGQYLGELGYPVPVPTRLPLPDGIALGDLSIGEEISIMIDGVPWIFIIVHKGSPGTMYRGFENSVTVMMKNLYMTRIWNTANNDYQNSTVNTWLNYDFFLTIDPNISSQIVQVKIPFRPSSGTSSTVRSGDDGMQTQIFLPSAHELAANASSNGTQVNYVPVDGTRFDYYSFMDTANSRRIATLNGKTNGWWVRSPYLSGNGRGVWIIRSSGSLYNNGTYANSTGYAVRPFFALPATYRIPI